MMKKILIWVLAIMLCLSMVPSLAADDAGENVESELYTDTDGGDEENTDDDEENTGDDEENTGDDEENTGDDEENTGDDEENTGDDEENTDDDEENTDDDEPTLYDKAVRYTIDSDEVLSLSGPDLGEACLDETGEQLSYIVITDIDARYGSLRYDYDGAKEEKVKDSVKYYRNSTSTSNKSISKISFVPKSTFSGEAEIYYTGYSDKKTIFEGMIVVTVNEAEEAGDLEKIIYYVDPGKKITFEASEINSVCRNSGFSLDYITFVLPDSDNGVLYYNYKASSSSNTKVTAKTKYYRFEETSSTKLIDNVTLLLSDDVEENFNVTYYAYDSDDEKYEGVISVKVNSDNRSYDISYEVTGECVFFTPSDFNNVCIEETGTKLSYVKFSNPSVGSLYYDYEDEEGEKAKMSTSKKYYYGKDPYLYLMAYVPKTDYEGTVSIDYVGYSVDDDSYNGTVTIKVDTSSVEQAADIEYSTKNTSYKTFSASSFTSACTKATGETLEYIKFTLPSSSQGTLYYKYSSSKDDNEKVSASTKYYSTESDYIKYVTFVPKSGYKGTVTINYTGFSDEGTRFTGKVKISVTGTTTTTSKNEDDDDDSPDAITYTAEKGKAVKFDAEDFFDVCDDYMGDDLYLVEFVAPSSSSGVLYYDYQGDDETKIDDEDEIYYEDDDEDFLLSKISFVPAKVGNITIRYTAYTIEDDDFDGTVVIKVAAKPEGTENFQYVRGYKNETFPDVDENAWYGARQTEAVKLAYRYGLMSGRADGTFDPLGNMTIAEAITIAARVHDIYYKNETEFDATGNPWYEDYVSYAITNKIITRSQFADYDEKITREEMAFIFANIIPEDAMEEINDVTEIPDVDEDNEYYSEILYLYNVGVLSGSDEIGTFNPGAYISRAEVSAIIVRVADPDERRENNF